MNNHQQKCDEELVRAVVGGQRHAFDEIVLRYCQPLTLFAVAKTRTLQDAEDIVQETFLRAYKFIHTFKSKYSLKNWLFTIAYRLVVSEHRKKRPQPLSDKAAVQLEAAEPNPQKNQWLWDAAQKMGAEAFTALWLRYKEDMTISEIAQVMKKTKVSIRVLLHRSRMRLAKKIAHPSEIPKRSPWIPGQVALLERTK